ncbi:MAG: glycosyltransferase [Bacteroidota bacterium]
MSKPHVIWITPGFAADEQDSRCIPPLQLCARHLQASGRLQLHIIALHYPFKKQTFHWHDIPVYPCYSSWGRPIIWGRALSHLHRLCSEHSVRALHSFWLSDAALMGHLFQKITSLPHWITLMGQDARPDNRYHRLLRVDRLRTVSLSEYHDNRLFQTTGHRADRIIPWGLPVDKREWVEQPRDIDVLGVGNLIQLKDYETFLRLLVRLRPDRPQLRAVLIGEGPERGRLEEQARAAGLSAHLTFTGSLPREEVLAYMRRSKVFLHPSTYESFGYVFLEALASGMRVVSRRVGWANRSDRWWLGQTEAELASVLAEALDGFDAPGPAYPCPIEQTASAYLSLYDLS